MGFFTMLKSINSQVRNCVMLFSNVSNCFDITLRVKQG